VVGKAQFQKKGGEVAADTDRNLKIFSWGKKGGGEKKKGKGQILPHKDEATKPTHWRNWLKSYIPKSVMQKKNKIREKESEERLHRKL